MTKRYGYRGSRKEQQQQLKLQSSEDPVEEEEEETTGDIEEMVVEDNNNNTTNNEVSLNNNNSGSDENIEEEDSNNEEEEDSIVNAGKKKKQFKCRHLKCSSRPIFGKRKIFNSEFTRGLHERKVEHFCCFFHENGGKKCKFGRNNNSKLSKIKINHKPKTEEYQQCHHNTCSYFATTKHLSRHEGANHTCDNTIECQGCIRNEKRQENRKARDERIKKN